MNYGMRCHDLCPKTDIDTLVNTIAANHVDQIQLAMGNPSPDIILIMVIIRLDLHG